MEKKYLLEAKNITKRFGGTTALDGVSFSLNYGEVHALMGENGAGKSTLAKIFAGIHQPNEGELFLEGEKLSVENPRAAKAKGISIVLQEFNLLPDLSVAENLFISNDEYYKLGFIQDKKKLFKRAKELLNLFEMGQSIDVNEQVKNLSIAQMQILEILKAVDAESKVIILDEPTAALSENEVKQLFDVIRQLKKEKNVGFIIVSHRIEEIFAIADRTTVFRDGKLILNGQSLSELSENDLVKAMVGREIKDLYGTRSFGTHDNDEVVFEAKDVCDSVGFLKNISITLHKGEIVGLTGLVGAGRTEFARCVFGIDKIGSGEVYVKGEKQQNLSIKNSIAHGIAYVPEDRKHDGLILDKSIAENMSICQHNMSKSPIINKRAEQTNVGVMREKLRIKMGHAEDNCDSLSGGNQQKVLLGKWLVMNPELLIIDEPTRGIDISAKSEIYGILNKLSEDGVTVLMISSEQPEIIGMCDRAIVMRDGRVTGELKHDELTEQKITTLATMG